MGVREEENLPTKHNTHKNNDLMPNSLGTDMTKKIANKNI